MKLLDFTIKLAEKAGETLIKESKKTLQISKKGKNDLVTQADKASEEQIIKTIKKTFPDHGIIAEESHTESELEEIAKAPYIWIIDPLDGTMNYAHGLPQYAVSIGVFKSKDVKSSKNFNYLQGELEVGVIYSPATNELFYAEKDKGAFLNGKKIHVSDTSKLSESLMVTGFTTSHAEQNLPYFSGMLPNCQGIRRLGSAALDLAYVAAGRFDGFWEFGLSPWDIAAGILIVKEAGGSITETSGAPLDLFGKDILATNGKIHTPTIKILSQI